MLGTSNCAKTKAGIASYINQQSCTTSLVCSCRSLVATNDHLLQELEDTKEKHAQEMLQMNINYEHLRKTIDLMQHV